MAVLHQLVNAFRDCHALPDHLGRVVGDLIQGLSELNAASQPALLKGGDGSLRRLNLRLDHEFATVVSTELPSNEKGFFRVESHVALRYWNVELVQHVGCLVLVESEKSVLKPKYLPGSEGCSNGGPEHYFIL